MAVAKRNQRIYPTIEDIGFNFLYHSVLPNLL